MNTEQYVSKFGKRIVDDYFSAIESLESGDVQLALRELERLAQSNFDPAIHSLAHCLQDGTGFDSPKMDYAIEYYTVAANLGNAASQNDLGLIYLEGTHVQRNSGYGLQLIEKSGRQGFLPAIFNLGVLYDEGLHIEADATKALALYEMAFKHGHKSAANHIGVFHASGRHNNPNFKLAKEWFLRGVASDDPHASKNLETLEKNLNRSPSELKGLWSYAKILFNQ